MRNIPAALTIAQTRVSTNQPLTQTEKDYVQSQSDLRRVENELKYLLETRNPDHPLVVEMKDKVAKARFLLNALVEPLKEEMGQRIESTRRKVTALQKMFVELQAEALDVGGKIAHHAKLEKQADEARVAYEKLHEQIKHYQGLANRADYVAIQQRATPATVIAQSGLIPVWRLWKSEPKLPVEEITPKSAPGKKEAAKTAG